MDPYAFTGDRLPGESWTARHGRMLAALPASGGTLIVVTNEIGLQLMKALRHDRGFAVRKAWRFIAVRRFDDCAKLDGLRGPIVVDWTVIKHAAPAAVTRMREAIAGAAAMEPVET